MSDVPALAQTVVTDRGTATANAPLQVVPMSPLAIIGVRALRTYAQSALGLLVLTLVVPAGVVAGDPRALGASFGAALAYAAVAALAPATISALQNFVELLAKLDATSPALRA